jgi:single-stranded DNA-binding protein
MTEASVSFAGNLTDDPELRHTEGGIARAVFRGGGVGPAGPGGVVLHRHRVARPGRARRPVLSKGRRVVVVGRLHQRS